MYLCLFQIEADGRLLRDHKWHHYLLSMIIYNNNAVFRKQALCEFNLSLYGRNDEEEKQVPELQTRECRPNPSKNEDYRSQPQHPSGPETLSRSQRSQNTKPHLEDTNALISSNFLNQATTYVSKLLCKTIKKKNNQNPTNKKTSFTSIKGSALILIN